MDALPRSKESRCLQKNGADGKTGSSSIPFAGLQLSAGVHRDSRPIDRWRERLWSWFLYRPYFIAPFLRTSGKETTPPQDNPVLQPIDERLAFLLEVDGFPICSRWTARCRC